MDAYSDIYKDINKDKIRESNCSEIPTGSTTKNDLGVDCVSRKEVEKLVYRFLTKDTDENIAFYEHFLDLPSVTPQPRKGHWIPLGYQDEWWVEVCDCSECGSSMFRNNYCPNCGARMFVPQESEDKNKS